MKIDANAFLGSWPFEPLPNSTPAGLSGKMRKLGIDAALASPVEGVFYKDPQEANEALARAIRRYDNLHLAAVVNPLLPHWEECLVRNREAHRAKAVKLHPNYHQFSLSDASAQALLARMASRRMPLMVQLQMEDARTHHPLAQVPPHAAADALAATRPFPRLPVVLGAVTLADLTANRDEISARANLFVDISWLECMDCMRQVLTLVDHRKLLFGTHQPFFYPESGLRKVEEGQLSASVRRAIFAENAARVFGI